MGINKVQYGNTVLIDLTDATATADKILQGYTAYGRDGSKLTGTATGGGSGDGYVWQDQDGYVHLSDEEGTQISVEALSVTQNGTYTAPTGKAYSPVSVSVSGGGGLVYEAGTWTPATDTASYLISFTNTHTTAPFYFMISDTTNTYYSTTNSNYGVSYINWEQIYGVNYDNNNDSSFMYGRFYYIYRGSSATSLSSGNFTITIPLSNTGESSTSYPRYWAKETGITAYSGDSRYWRAGRTYKWIAVWAPTT